MFGWALEASQQRVEYSGSSNNTIDNGRVNATLSLTPDPSLRLSASGGRESIDQSAGAEHRAGTTSGLGLSWNPSPRTNLGVEVGERYFGRSARVSFSHRMQRSIVSYNFTRDATQSADAFSMGATTPDPADRSTTTTSVRPDARGTLATALSA